MGQENGSGQKKRQGRKVLMVFGAHCDDIELCFAGTMLKYHEKFGYEIIYVQSTNNMSGRWSSIKDGRRVHKTIPWYVIMPQRKIEAAAAAREFFGTTPIHLDYPQRHYTDRALKSVELRYGAPCPDCVPANFPTIMTAYEDPAAVERVAGLILDKDPEVILSHPAVDYTFEHTGTSLLVRNAYEKALQGGYDGSFILAACHNNMRLGDFFNRWDAFIDTTGFQEKKIRAIGMHACQIPNPQNIDPFDRRWGQACGCETAEAYTVVRLSDTRGGALTDEFVRSHAYCLEHWREMFLS